MGLNAFGQTFWLEMFSNIHFYSSINKKTPENVLCLSIIILFKRKTVIFIILWKSNNKRSSVDDTFCDISIIFFLKLYSRNKKSISELK